MPLMAPCRPALTRLEVRRRPLLRRSVVHRRATRDHPWSSLTQPTSPPSPGRGPSDARRPDREALGKKPLDRARGRDPCIQIRLRQTSSFPGRAPPRPPRCGCASRWPLIRIESQAALTRRLQAGNAPGPDPLRLCGLACDGSQDAHHGVPEEEQHQRVQVARPTAIDGTRAHARAEGRPRPRPERLGEPTYAPALRAASPPLGWTAGKRANSRAAWR
jgi:hypothetical protein